MLLQSVTAHIFMVVSRSVQMLPRLTTHMFAVSPVSHILSVCSTPNVALVISDTHVMYFIYLLNLHQQKPHSAAFTL